MKMVNCFLFCLLLDFFDFHIFKIFKNFKKFKSNRLIFSEPMKPVQIRFVGFYKNGLVFIDIVIHGCNLG
jgi:hypothetical protein